MPESRVLPRLDARLVALGLTTALRRDAALAAALAAVTVGLLVPLTAAPDVAAALGGDPRTWTVAIALATVQTLALALRRVRPVGVLVTVTALQLVLIAVLPSGVVIGGVATAIVAYTCGTLLGVRRTALLVSAAAATEIAVGLVDVAVAAGPTGEPLWLLVFGLLLRAVLVHAAPALGGIQVAARRRWAADVVAAHRDRADAAVARERARMARELHDVAAHHLSAMVVQAAVVERMVESDPERARATAAQVREQGRRTLRDLRLVVGALREDGAADPAGEGPVPGLAELDALVAHARELGTPVALERRGEPVALAPVADVTCFRVTQEALANAREHAPGAAVTVVVAHDDGAATVEITHGPAVGPVGPPDGSRGFGLAGMRERAHLIGATFRAGPTDDGGWRVRLVVPLDRDTADPADTAADTAADDGDGP